MYLKHTLERFIPWKLDGFVLWESTYPGKPWGMYPEQVCILELGKVCTASVFLIQELVPEMEHSLGFEPGI